jgi:hypothetical protein
MPIDNVTVNVTSSQGAQLKSLQNLINQARNLARQIAEQMNQQTDGTTFTAIETQFGLPSGDGETVYNLTVALTGATGLLEVAGIVQFCGRLN